MVSREERLSEFSTGVPAASGPFELLCEDERGTYVLPFACSYREGGWLNLQTAEQIEVTVIGWRVLIDDPRPQHTERVPLPKPQVRPGDK